MRAVLVRGPIPVPVAAWAVAAAFAIGAAFGCGGAHRGDGEAAVTAKADAVQVTYYYLPG